MAACSLLLFLLIVPGRAKAQSKDPTDNKRIVLSKNYIFTPQTVPGRRIPGLSQVLDPSYELIVLPDSVISYLPFFGRAFAAPANPTEGGIRFTSTKFSYTMSQKKKGGWEVSIKPSDATDVRQLYLDIYENGTASLRVVSLNREQITFNGYITEGKERGKKAF